jgi:dienelactone hydrolase
LIALFLGACLTGCVVGQRPGQGQVLHLAEPTTNGWYWLYLPVGHDQEAAAGRSLPLVMTFHGMKPFDTARSQIREWQQEADRYGYVVCAPELLVPDLLSPLPLSQVNGALETDERRILAIMDELARRANIDPNAVLSTSWSYGGYVAHYMANRYPERFSCLAVKQSDFSESLLDPQNIPRYRDHKVGIFYTENDFKRCRDESKAAAQWYHRHGFDVKFAVFQDLGHERTPSLAASFFAQTCNATPKTPPVELARLQVKEIPPDETVALARAEPSASLPRSESARPRPLPGSSQIAADAPRPFEESGTWPGDLSLGGTQPDARDGSPGGGRKTGRTRTPPRQSVPLRTRPLVPPPTRKQATPQRKVPPIRGIDPKNPVRVRVSSTIGISPLLVSYSASLPAHLQRGAFYLWTDNGEPISNGINGQKFLSKPGTHRLEVLVTTPDGREFRARQTVTVLERINKRSASD